MRLIKEVYEGRDSNGIQSIGYIKKYDINGNLTYFNDYHTYDGICKSYVYNDLNKIVKEKISISKGYGEPNEEREKNYEYNESGFRVLEYQTKIIHDSATAPELAQGGLITAEQYSADYPIEVNNLISIEDVKVKDGNIISKKVTDLIENTTIQEDYEYENGLLVCKSIYEVYKSEKRKLKEIIRKYNGNQKLIAKEIYRFNELKKEMEENIKYEYPEVKSAFSNQKEIIVTTNEYNEKETSYFDYKGNIIQEKNDYGERVIYINNYSDLTNMLESITIVDIQEDSHELIGMTKFYYEED